MGAATHNKNKRRAACWSSLLLGVSLRAGAWASVGVVSWGFSDDGSAINTHHQCCALLCAQFGPWRQAEHLSEYW